VFSDIVKIGISLAQLHALDGGSDFMSVFELYFFFKKKKMSYMYLQY
jgi:hypothetical protein